MALTLPILDDKLFAQLAEEMRALIPGTAPEWTDHNVHDPGITFIELFAWLAEIQHYRLDRTSAASFERFLSLAGVTPLGPRAAEVTVNFEFSSLTRGGSLLSAVTDLKDPAGLAVKLRDAGDPLSQYLRGQLQLPPAAQQQLEKYDGSSSPPEPLKGALVSELNRLLRGPSLFDEGRFAGVALTDETRRLIERAPKGEGLVRLNRLLLEDAYPSEIARSLKGLFVPANTKIWSIGNESLPFQTIRDLYLTRARLKRVVTKTTAREIVKTNAEENEVGHYEAFGPAPAVGDVLQLEFDQWFAEPQGQLTVLLFEDDLPRRAPVSPGAPGFEPSATVRWEYRIDSVGDSPPRWAPLDIIEDGTSSLSQSGDLVFRSPAGPGAEDHRQIRAVLSAGSYEIPPRIVSIRTNTVRARQVETIVNETLGAGLGTADQVVRLRKAPLFINPAVDDGPFQAGEVLDWNALLDRLKRAGEVYESPLKETVLYIARKLRELAADLPESNQLLSDDGGKRSDGEAQLTDDEKYFLARAFNTLLSQPDFYQRTEFRWVSIPEEFLKAGRVRTCRRQNEVRRFNRWLLQRVFPDLFVTDRLEVQVGLPATRVEDEPRSWSLWERVDDFQESGPADRHYVLDPEAGTIRFGNGLNGRVPGVNELIRARFYRHSQLEKGNLAAHRQWALDVQLPPETQFSTRENPEAATGGKGKETLDDAKMRARKVFHTETAVVTAKDYENLAVNTPGLRVARVKVKPNFNPRLPRLRLPGEVTIIALPQPPPRQAFPDAAAPEASEGFLKTMLRHVDSRRTVTTNVHVIGPRYEPVKVGGRVYLKKRASEDGARESISRTLSEFFDPVFGGPDKGKGWPFGRAVFPSEVSQRLAKLPEVEYVTGVALNDLKAGEGLKLRYDQLPAPGGHALELVTFEMRGREADPLGGGESCG